MKVFFDTEFTGLRKDTSLISIGCVSEDGRTFYAELTDYDRGQVDDWIGENVIANLSLGPWSGQSDDMRMQLSDTKAVVGRYLAEWLKVTSTRNAVYGDMRNVYPDRCPQKIEMWSDCLAYDWVLFCDLFGGAFGIPECVYYIPFDLATLLKIKGVDPDVNREEYIANGPPAMIAAMFGVEPKKVIGGPKHNALHDAKVIKACYEKAIGRRAA